MKTSPDINQHRPNVLFIMSDQHHAGCTGYAGHPDVKTPNLDRLAARSVNFSRGYANNPICSPSRICFHTGQYMKTHRMYGNYHNGYSKPNPDTLGERFRRYGYQTALIGKSHMVPLWDRNSFEHIRYTDLCDADRGNPRSVHYFDYLCEKGLDDRYEDGGLKPGQEYVMDGSAPSALPYEHSLEAYTGRETLKFLETRDASRPFFIHMSFQRPHAPISAAKEFFDLYDPSGLTLPENYGEFQRKRFEGKPAHLREVLGEHCEYPMADDSEARMRRCLASYYGLITAIDLEIGKVLDALEASGELDHTVIIYTADHGDFAGEHGLFHKNLGLYEAVQRVPYLVSLPGGPQGIIKDQLVESVDLYPTLCEVCGVPLPETCDGISLTRVLNGEICKQAVFCEWEMFWPKPHRVSSVRTDRYRLVYYSGYDGGELYDHETDPGEVSNLWNRAEFAALQSKLLQRLLSFSMNYAQETNIASDIREAANDRYMPARLVHAGGIYWSDLEKTFTDIKPWKSGG